MLRNLTAGAVLGLVLAAAPIGFVNLHIGYGDAKAIPGFRPGNLAPGKSRTFSSSGEFRVCNDGSAPVRMWVDNSLTNAPTDSLLAPGQCIQNMGHIMTFTNESKVAVQLDALGGLGGRAPQAGSQKGFRR